MENQEPAPIEIPIAPGPTKKGNLQLAFESPDVKRPDYSHEGDGWMNLYAYLPKGPIIVGTHRRMAIPTGIRAKISPGYRVELRSRSGMALKDGVVVTGGAIDSCYRGEIMVILHNTDAMYPFTVTNGQKIAQFSLERFTHIQVEEITTEELGTTSRGDGGFGSTDI